SHRSAGRFAKHYREMLSGKSEHSLIGDELSLPSILGRATYIYRHRELVSGVHCHRLDLVAQPERNVPSAQALADATEGSLWLAVEGLHMVRWQTRLVRSVHQGIARVEKLQLRVELEERGESWLPSEIELLSEVGIGPITLRKRNRYLYSEFRRRP
ncbi:MAG: hypothetical protein KDD47_03230, partial [Acidobacteria bacterium]|nr:hypothetical protein [Acidobacteriota bacterium]